MRSRWRMVGCAVALLVVSSCGASGGRSDGGRRPSSSTTTTRPVADRGLIALEQGVFDKDERLVFFDPVTEEVTPVPGGEFGYYARFSSDGSMLVWSRMRDSSKGVDGVMVHDLRTGKTRKIAGDGGCPAFAPDNRSVVVSGARRIDLRSGKIEPLPGPGEGCRIELDDGRFVLTHQDEEIRLLDGEHAETIYEAAGAQLDTASLSPDGSKLAFVEQRKTDGTWDVHVMVMGVDGSNPRPVERGLAFGTGWSPDGISIATADIDAGEDVRSLWIIDTEDGGLEKVLPGPINTPTWGPSGPTA